MVETARPIWRRPVGVAIAVVKKRRRLRQLHLDLDPAIRYSGSGVAGS